MQIKALSQSGLENTGWNAGQGDVLLVNPKLGKLIRVAVCKDDGTPVYDQFLHAEPVGAVTIPVNSKGEIGFITQQRWTADPTLYDFETIEDNLDIVGMPSIELPRGFPINGEASEQTATREGAEEIGSPVTSVKKLGVVTPNTAFNPHQVPVYWASIDEAFQGEIPGDVNEKILAVNWFSLEELRSKIASGEIYCGFTLAALGLAFMLGEI